MDEFLKFFDVDNPIGQTVIYIIIFLAISSILYIISYICKYLMYENKYLNKLENNLINSSITGEQYIVELMDQVPKNSIIGKRLKDIKDILSNKGGQDQDTLAKLTSLEESGSIGTSLTNYAMGIFVILGLIGTIAGISIMLQHFDSVLAKVDSSNISALLDSMAQSVESMRSVMTGMHTAFSASIIGLSAMVIVGFLVRIADIVKRKFILNLERFTACSIIPRIKI